ncbi:MAG: DUF4249 domain-containing protein [Bacteroidota bacterium]|nr:DUF4249 domain-containing protein [Bacteroidota bacterium]
MYFKRFIPLLFCFTFTSCLREKIVLDDFGTSNAIAVTSFLTANDLQVHVKLSKASKVIGGGFEPTLPITDATVEMNDGQENLEFLYDQMSDSYISSPASGFFVTEKQFNLQVKVPGLGQFSSSTKIIPQFLPEISEGSVRSETINGQTNYQFSLKWKDQVGAVNYYRLMPVLSSVNKNDPLDSLFMPLHQNKIFVYDETSLKEGEIQIEENVLSTNFGIDEYRVIGLKFFLLNVDENYYKYHLGIQKLNGFEDFNNPVFLFGNIQNGYGVFSSYNGMTQKTFYMK